ncbi:hypothetical protein PF011_g32278, partial [Phytophthora fragariae]
VRGRCVGAGSVHQGHGFRLEVFVKDVLPCAGSVHQGRTTCVDAVLVKEVLRAWTLCRRGVGVGGVHQGRAACVDAVLLVKEVLRAWTLCRRGVGVGSVHQGRAACVDAVLVLEACTKDMDFD